MSEGYSVFKQTGAKLKADVDREKEAEATAKDVAVTQLAQIRQNRELSQMYADSAKIGANNLAGELPLLKVHSAGRSTKNELANGKEPYDGWFFYKPTGEQFETIECHILTISRGFRAEGMEGKGDVFNQILGGVTLDGKPFIMYFTGLKLSYLWEFGKVANKFTHAKPFSIPMFALTVLLTTKKVENNFGKSWVVEFEIKKLKDNEPELIIDEGEFQYLKDSVLTIEETINSLIATKAKESIVEPARPIRENEEVRGEVSLKDIPF